MATHLYVFKLVFSEHQEWDCKIIWHHLHLFDKDTFTTLYYKEVLMYVQCELKTAKWPRAITNSQKHPDENVKKKKKTTCLKINGICWLITTVNPILKVKILNYISQPPCRSMT